MSSYSDSTMDSPSSSSSSSSAASSPFLANSLELDPVLFVLAQGTDVSPSIPTLSVEFDPTSPIYPSYTAHLNDDRLLYIPKRFPIPNELLNATGEYCSSHSCPSFSRPFSGSQFRPFLKWYQLEANGEFSPSSPPTDDVWQSLNWHVRGDPLSEGRAQGTWYNMQPQDGVPQYHIFVAGDVAVNFGSLFTTLDHDPTVGVELAESGLWDILWKNGILPERVRSREYHREARKRIRIAARRNSERRSRAFISALSCGRGVEEIGKVERGISRGIVPWQSYDP